MWTKKTTSPSPEFPQRIDLIRFLFEQLTQRQINSSWIHLEAAKESGFLKNLFAGQPLFVEVGFGEDNFELNLGYKKNKRSEIPPYWQEIKNGLIRVPRSDSEVLCDWINLFFNEIFSSSPNKILSGWIDGL